MSEHDHAALVRDCYRAWERGDRDAIERLICDDFEFSSPDDVGLDRDRYFERCWPNAGRLRSFELTRLIEHGDEVAVTYVATRVDGSRFCNTEVLTFAGDQLRRAEVYYGWELAAAGD